jgi:phosphatidylinositol alpha-1,6-mannosyltransferase
VSRPFTVLSLVTDAYGGLGGIAAYNRDVIQALSEHPQVARTVIVPRVTTFEPGAKPDRVEQRDGAMASLGTYIWTSLREARRLKPSLIHCAHANLSSVAALAAQVSGARWTLSLYGTDVWEANANRITRRAIDRADLYLPISSVTEARFRAIHPGAGGRSAFLPNALHREQFGPGARSAALAARHGLGSEPLILTIARLGADYELKGFGRVIALLPRIAERVPRVRYMICGMGPAKERVEAMAREAGVADRLILAGYVSEEEKADYYRLADAFVMPSTGEGFGFVFTEAMACGIPVVASSIDGGIDAVRGGLLGRAVDPFDAVALEDAIVAALGTPKHVPDGLDYFDYPHFRERLYAAIDPLMERR